MNRTSVIVAAMVVASVPLGAGRPSPGPAAASQVAPAAARQPAAARLELSVEGIMRGPRLVGYPPSGLRWSGDSRELYFEWRKPGEEEAATYAVSREGGEPRKLSDEERKLVPPASGGRWDTAHRRVLFAEAGDIVLLDGVTRARRQITRTSAGEANPRWARDEKAVTFTRDGHLFLLPLEGGGLEQVTDVQPWRRETRETDSQRFLKAEEHKLLEFTREAVEKRKQADEKRKKDAPPVFELQEGQTVADQALSPDGDHVFLLVNERPSGAKTADTPNYVTESAYSEMIPGRPKVGDIQGRLRLAALNIRTGKSVWADAAFAGKRQVVAPSAQGGDRKEVDREVSWSMPILSTDGRLAVAWARAADFKDRWIVAVDPESGKARVVDQVHDDAWVLDGVFGATNAGFLADQKHLYFTAEKDGWAHLHVVDASRPGDGARALTSGRFEVVGRLALRRPDAVLSHLQRAAPRRTPSLLDEGGGRRAGGDHHDDRVEPVHRVARRPDPRHPVLRTATSRPRCTSRPSEKGAAARQVTTTPTEEWRSFKWIDPQIVTFKARDGAEVYARLYTPEMLGARRAATRPAVLFVHGAGYLQNAHKYWSTYSREYMFHHLLADAATWCSTWTTGLRGLWTRLADGHLPAHGRQGSGRLVDGAKYLVKEQGWTPRRIGAVRRQLRRLHHADGDVHHARHLRGGGGAAAGDRLGALQPRVHRQHPEPAAGRRGGLPQEFTDLLRRGAEGRAADLPRHGGHERALPGLGAAGRSG